MEEKYKCQVCGEYFFDKYDDYTECPVCGQGNCADQNEKSQSEEWLQPHES